MRVSSEICTFSLLIHCASELYTKLEPDKTVYIVLNGGLRGLAAGL